MLAEWEEAKEQRTAEMGWDGLDREVDRTG